MQVGDINFLGDRWGKAGLVQIRHAVVSNVVSGSTVMPVDDTIPQVSEGFEILSCAITPKSTSNLLLIQAAVGGTFIASGSGMGGLALFQSYTGYSDTNALAAVTVDINYQYSYANNVLFHKMAAPATSEVTFSLRIGKATSGTIYINTIGGAATRFGGGVCATTLTIFEYAQ